MDADALRENDVFVCQLRSALSKAEYGLADVPALLKAILRDNRWRHRRLASGGSADFDRFEEFVTTPPIEGLGADMPLIRRIVADDAEAQSLLEQAIGSRQGERSDLFNNIQEVPRERAPVGTSSAAALRRLRAESEDNPDVSVVYDRVLAGEISPHRAMVTLGYRKPTVTLPLDPQRAARIIVKHLPPADVKALIIELSHAAGFSITHD